MSEPIKNDQEKDPVVHSSLSKPLFISSALLVISMVWGLYDEAYGIRPWKGYQARFLKEYSAFLKTAAGGEAAVERQIKASSEYKRLDAAMQAAEKSASPAAGEIDKKINQELVPKILALNEPFQEVRSHIGALTYQIEVSHSESSKDSLRKEIEGLRAEKRDVSLPGEAQKRSMDFKAMSDQLQAWKDEKAKLLQQRVELMKQATELRAERDKYLSDRIAEASSATIASVQNGLDSFDIRIRQIHVKDVDLVDRCESCHLGTREPVTITGAAMGGDQVFASHPEQGTAENPRSGKVRLHALPRRQWRGAFERGEGARVQQVLVVAAASQGEYRGGLPAVPCQGNRHGDGARRWTRGARFSDCAAAWPATATRASTARRTRSPA